MGTKKILIVEDDMLLSLVEERIIQKIGYQVVGKASAGKEAVQKIQALKPDLVIMDIILKDEMDGIEVMEQVRQFSDVPVIYLSGNSDRFNYERAKKTNFEEYLIKPITYKDLKDPITRIFEPTGLDDMPEAVNGSRSGQTALRESA